MARGNRQGPGGEGPRTGRGEGFCGGGNRPGFESEAARRHVHSGRRSSDFVPSERREIRRRHLNSAEVPAGERKRIRRHLHASDENRMKALRQEADLLRSRARAIEQEIKHLSGEHAENND